MKSTSRMFKTFLLGEVILLLVLVLAAPAGAGTITIDFDSVPVDSTGFGNPSAYLAGFGITLSYTFPGSEVVQLFAADDRFIYDTGDPTPSVVQAPSPHNIALPGGSNGPITFTLHFSTPLNSFAFTRVLAFPGAPPTSHPAWAAVAFDAEGHEIASAGEGFLLNGPPATFTLSAASASITRVTFFRDGTRGTQSTNTTAFSHVLTDNWVLTGPGVGGIDGVSEVVVPNAQATIEGNGENSFPLDCGNFNFTSMRYQQVYAASEIGLTGTITELRFRQDVGAGGGFGPNTIPHAIITLSSTTATPDSLSPTFALNVGPDVTTVYNGDLVLSSTSSSASPRPFDLAIPVRAPFVFDAAAGNNLLLDVTLPTCATTSPLDVQTAFADSVSRIFALGACSATGTQDTEGLITQFTIQPSPPSTGPRARGTRVHRTRRATGGGRRGTGSANPRAGWSP